jgi:hypothetical protein
VSGVALALSGTFVDPALWMTSPEAKRAAVDAFLNLLPVTVPLRCSAVRKPSPLATRYPRSRSLLS